MQQRALRERSSAERPSLRTRPVYAPLTLLVDHVAVHTLTDEVFQEPSGCSVMGAKSQEGVEISADILRSNLISSGPLYLCLAGVKYMMIIYSFSCLY